jgi:hypothetical protein
VISRKDCLLSGLTILESFRAPRSVISFNLPSLGYNRRFVCKTIVVRKATEKGQNDKQRSAKHSHKAKDGFTRTPPKTGDEFR